MGYLFKNDSSGDQALEDDNTLFADLSNWDQLTFDLTFDSTGDNFLFAGDGSTPQIGHQIGQYNGPVVTLLGSTPVAVEVFDSYELPGATAEEVQYDSGTGLPVSTDLSGSVVVSGDVNFDVVGTYLTSYSATGSCGITTTATLTINVFDPYVPTISLNGSNPMNVIQNTSFTDPGAVVTDNYDSGLIAVVTGTVDTAVVGQYVLYYDASDSSGNAAEQVSRTVNVVAPGVDINPPVVSLNGSTSMTVSFGGTFTDPGATATDDVDGTLTVEVSGTVDTSTSGQYFIEYTACDTAENCTTETRTVMVEDAVEPDPPVAPDTPVLVTPLPSEEITSFLLPLTTAAYSSAGAAHGSTRWQLATDASFSALVLDITSQTELTTFMIPNGFLAPLTPYYWRAMFIDTLGASSAWSAGSFFMTGVDSADQNANGVPDDQEPTGAVDLDGDGTDDSAQTDLFAVVVTDDTAKTAGVKLSGDADLQLFESVDSADLNTQGAPESLPFGLFTLSLAVPNAGDSTTVTVYFSEAVDVDAVWYKNDPVTGVWSEFSGAVFSADRLSVALTLTDGGAGDGDGIANGIIVDPSGPGINPTTPDPAPDTSGGGGGGCSTSQKGPVHGVTWLLVLSFLVLLGRVNFLHNPK